MGDARVPPSQVMDLVKRFELSSFLSTDEKVCLLADFKVWLIQHNPHGMSIADEVFKTEGLSMTASQYMVRFLKCGHTSELATEIIQLLTPLDVLCGSSKERSFVYEFLGRKVTIYTGNQQDVGLGFKVWPSAERALQLLAQDLDIRGRRVIELGAGIGLVAVCAAMAGAASVLATDFVEGCLDLCELNFKTNTESSRTDDQAINPQSMRTRKLDWNDVGVSDFLDDVPKGSFVIGTDVIYYPEHGDSLYKTLNYLFEKKIACDALIILGMRPVRPGVDCFLQMLDIPHPLWEVSVKKSTDLVEIRFINCPIKTVSGLSLN